MRKALLSFIFLLTCTLAIQAADKVIRGKVLAKEDNSPLIGASVYVSSEDLKEIGYQAMVLGTKTDIEGNYTLTVPEEVERVFCAYIGFVTQEVKIPKSGVYNIDLLVAEQTLEGVVVTGYQNIERRKLTAAVSKVDISDEKVGAIHSVDQALAGQVAGVSAIATSGAPGAPVKIRIRGTSSINGVQDPLWVLDGIPMEGTDIPSMKDLKDIDNIYSTSIAGLNPADIESITVLKDAAATAIYGARAANGVIVITTKKGKEGKPVVNFSTRLTYTPNIDIDRLNLMNSEEKVGLELDLLRSNYTYRESQGGVARIIAAAGLTDAYKAGGWGALTPEAQAAINRLKTINTDWNDILFRSTFGQEYNVSVSGGGNKATYYSSFGYYDEQGNVKGVGTNRFNLTQKVNYQFNDMLKAGLSIFANQRKTKSYLTDSESFTSPVYYSRRANPYFEPFDAEGNYVYDPDIQGRSTYGIIPFNIFEERNNTKNENLMQSMNGIFDLELRFDRRFKLTSQLGIQIDRSTLEKIADAESYALRKERVLSIYAYNDGQRPFLPEGGFHKQTENRSSQVTWKGMGEYRDSFQGGRHEVEAMLGMELRKYWYDGLFSAAYGYDPQTLQSTPVIYPNENLASSFPLSRISHVENAYVSAFSTFSYSFLRRYTLGGSIRFDGSDAFGVAKKYRYTPLYSVSGRWQVSQEEFMKNIRFMDNWNIRASYGVQGNMDKSVTSFLVGQINKVTILPGNSEDKIDVPSAPNDKLRWEKTYSVNAGTDASFLDGAINFTFDYYYRKGVDLISYKTLPLESGFSSTSVNWASMRNQGFEISLGTRNIHTKNFTWYTNFNLGYNENTILEEAQNAGSAAEVLYPSRVGRPVGAIFAYKTAGLDADGYPLFVAKDGRTVTMKEFFQLRTPSNGLGVETGLSGQEQRDLYSYIGSSDPKFSGGFNNTFEYDRFTLTVNCIFNFGFYVQTQPTYSIFDYDRGLNTCRDILDRKSPSNPNGKYPNLISENSGRREEYLWYSTQPVVYNNLDIWIKKCNYLRVQNIRLGYNIPENWLSSLRIKKANIAIEGRNLFVISSNYDNYLDPETMGNPYAQPIPKSVIFSLNLTL